MRIGIDLGGTKIEAIAIDADGRELDRQRVATPAGDYDATLDVIRTLVVSMEAKLGRTATVGVGTPGSVSPSTGLMRNANSVVLNGRRLIDDISTALARTVTTANDANCFTLSEATDGAGAGHAVVFGVILGTGVGGGIAINGRVLNGRNAIAGEWGHNALPRIESIDLPLPGCYCGRAGCIECYLSGPALAADHARHAVAPSDLVTPSSRARTAQDIVHAARSGNAAAHATMQRYYRRLAKSLASVINILDPNIIVLGGGLSNVAEIYEEVPRLLPEFVFADASFTPVVCAKHGDSSGVRGAAWLAKAE